MNPTEQALDDLVVATRILVNEQVIDGFGHVSVRDPVRSDRYFMTRSNFVVSPDAEALVELDLESNPVRAGGQRPSIERFIHGEIYRARPDVNAVVHTHAPALIPFGVSRVPLRPLYHMCGFLAAGTPVFDIKTKHGVTNMLIVSRELGQDLATRLGKSAMVLMRGHGASVVGGSVREAVFRAVYATVNAQLQPIAMQLGEPTYLSEEEAALTDALHGQVLSRPWDYWKSRL